MKKTAEPNNGLLTLLAELRDTLGVEMDRTDASAARRCIAATDAAMSAAMSAERIIIEQLIRIEEMERVASTDELTGALNRRGFEQEFTRVMAASRRFGETGVLVYIDLDNFKPINDTYGHCAGDKILEEVTNLLKANVRPNDSVARMGGDEFAVLLTRTNWEDGLKRAEALDAIVNAASIEWKGRNIQVGASFGFQRFGPSDDGKTLLGKADQAMYEAKKIRSETRHAYS